MKDIKFRSLVVLIMLISFCMVACSNHEDRAKGGEKKGGDRGYLVSKVVEITDDGELVYNAEYDSKGLPVCYEMFGDNERIATVELEHDDSGLLVSVEKAYHYPDGSNELEIIQYSYNRDGNVVEEIHSDEDGFVYCNEYAYYETDNAIMRFDRSKDGELTPSVCKYYDDEGRLVKEQFHRESDGIIELTRVYSYNDKGDITVYEGTDNYGAQLFLEEYENTYNERNELVKVKSVENREDSICTYTHEYVYDKQGNRISETITCDIAKDTATASSVSRYEWTYDNNGNVLSEAFYNMQDGEHMVYKREFSYVAYSVVQNRKGQIFEITQMFRNFGQAEPVIS